MNQSPNIDLKNGANKFDSQKAINTAQNTGNKVLNKADKFINETADKAGRKMDEAADESEGYMGDFGSSMKEGTAHLGDLISEKAHNFRDRLDARLSDGKEMMGQVSSAAGEVETSVRNFVSRRPITTVAVAAGIGFLAAKLLSRSSVSKATEKLN